MSKVHSLWTNKVSQICLFLIKFLVEHKDPNNKIKPERGPKNIQLNGKKTMVKSEPGVTPGTKIQSNNIFLKYEEEKCHVKIHIPRRDINRNGTGRKPGTGWDTSRFTRNGKYTRTP